MSITGLMLPEHGSQTDHLCMPTMHALTLCIVHNAQSQCIVHWTERHRVQSVFPTSSKRCSDAYAELSY